MFQAAASLLIERMIQQAKVNPAQNGPQGFVRERRGKFYIDRTKKLATLIPNEIILHELVRFLETRCASRPDQRILDAGAGTKPYFPIYQRYFSSCISFDVSHSPHDIANVDLISSASALPFQDNSFDCIICTEVLEHLPEPISVLREFRRVLKTNGVLFLTTPFLVQLHEAPYDFYRYTPFALEYMARQAGLAVENIVAKGGYSAFALLQVQFLVSKFWRGISKATRIRLYHSWNPVIYLSMVVPQLLYVKWWKRNRARQSGAVQDGRNARLGNITLGYVTIMAKP